MTLLDLLSVQGTNFGLKSHSCSMKPTMNMDNAAQAINTQQDLKVAELEAMILNDYLLTNKLYSDLLTNSTTLCIIGRGFDESFT